MQKKLQPDSTLNLYDIDANGVVTDEEIDKHEKMVEIDNKDKREDAQRRMAWFALTGMLLYPFSVVLSSMLNLESASQILGDMAAVYFVSVAAIVAAFYGSQAYTSKNNNENE